jgi:hypothetical protein
LFQYAFARAYAEKYDCILQTPSWIGQHLFNIKDSPIIHKLPSFNCEKQIPNGQINIDLFGYFQNSQCLSLMTRSWLKSIFKFKEEWEQKFVKELNIVGHLRRGDYLKFDKVYCIIKESSLYKACEKFNLNKEDMTIILEDDKKFYSSVPPELQFLPDFMLMKNAKILLRSNSTYSWWAGVLGNGMVFSPIVDDKVGWNDVNYVEGNYPKFLDVKNTNYSSIHNDLFLKD